MHDKELHAFHYQGTGSTPLKKNLSLAVESFHSYQAHSCCSLLKNVNSRTGRLLTNEHFEGRVRIATEIKCNITDMRSERVLTLSKKFIALGCV